MDGGSTDNSVEIIKNNEQLKSRKQTYEKTPDRNTDIS